MLGNNCVGCYWPKSSKPGGELKQRTYGSFYDLKPRVREKIYDSETELFDRRASSSGDLLARDPHRVSSSGSPVSSTSGCWMEVRSLPRRRGAARPTPRGGRHGVLAWLNLMSDCDIRRRHKPVVQSDYDDVVLTSSSIFHQETEDVVDVAGNLQEIHASYQGKRSDFVDDILENPLFIRRRNFPEGEAGHSRPFIQAVDDKQVLVGGVEPLHLSHAMRRRDHVFHCYEFLLLTRLDTDKDLWNQLCERFGYCDECRGGERGCATGRQFTHTPPHSRDLFKVSSIKPDLWFLAVTLKDSKDKLIHFIRTEMPRRNFPPESSSMFPVVTSESLLSSYLSAFNFVELRLDNVLEEGAQLPADIFRCTNVTTLSLKNNFLTKISPEIGKMSKLERLFLTNNQLNNRSIPFTIAFCGRLSEVYLDNNQLDALPCILLRVHSLERVHRHGNHNYFKNTFMFYHTDINDRILKLPGIKFNMGHSLQKLAGNAVLTSRHNFFADPNIPPRIKDFLTSLADKKELCDQCSEVLPLLAPCYRVFTFKNPYLGNTCVPFQHIACSEDCAQTIEVPARKEQMISAIRQDLEYAQYIRDSKMHLEGIERTSRYSVYNHTQTQTGSGWSDTLISRSSRRTSAGSRVNGPVESRSGLQSPQGGLPRGITRSSSGSQTTLSGSRTTSSNSLRQSSPNCGIF